MPPKTARKSTGPGRRGGGTRGAAAKKTPQSFAFSELSSCSLFRLCVDHEVNSLVKLSTESGETFFEGLLTNGWQLKLVSKCGEVEKSIAKWTFHLMLYSSKEVLRNAAVDFWCAILSLKNEDESPSIKIDWLPSYSELNGALETFGFVFHSPTKDSSDTEMLSGGIFIVLLPHQKQKSWWLLSVELNECMLALVNFFTDDEWRSSYVQVTKSVASRVPKDMNSLRVVECISVVHGPTKLLRSEVTFRILLGCFDKVEDEEEVVMQLTLINLKDKSCDLFKVYIYLVFTENWFLYKPLFEDNQLLNEMWGLFL
ncbi:hypothetical protein HanIR_Chr05g0232891 [Helianthus annuus]|nr:hypothetical protein HanIR_Chr05g0232891 [Helianthus annuus]